MKNSSPMGSLSPEPPEGALRLLDTREGDAGASAAIFTRRAGGWLRGLLLSARAAAGGR